MKATIGYFQTLVGFSLSSLIAGLLMYHTLIGVSPVQAADHYNLERGLPVQVEDTIPTPYRNREIQGLLQWERKDDGDDRFTAEPRLEYGIFRNAQVSLAVPFEFGSDVEDDGLGDIELGMLYNFNQESFVLPATALSLEIAFPTSDESDGIQTTLKFIASKTIGRTSSWHRVHLNAAWNYNGDPDDDERRNYYTAIIGYDVRITGDMLLVLDFIREQQKEEDRDSNIVEAGIRYQLTPLTVIALGAGAGIGDESPDFRAAMAFQRSF
ncbi:MAG: hypothetical protein C4519_12705 [Desulfobacteraceae bacterium]|nr:MAG: hypothetical protein C4519_12705 [Desulfobacteraceae bacterium]